MGGLAGAGGLALNGANLIITNGNEAQSNVTNYTGILSDGTAPSSLTKDATSTGIGIQATVSLYSGAAVQTLTNSNTYTGPTTVNGGVLQLLSSNTATNIISPSSTLVMGGGMLAIVPIAANPSPTQTFNGMTINAGGSQFQSFRLASNTTIANIGAITRNIGGTIDFQSRPSGSSSNAHVGAADGGDRTTTTNASFTGGSASILGGWATFNSTTWAVSGGSGSNNMTALATFSTTFAAGTNVDAPTGNTAVASGLTINSLRLNGAGAANISLGAPLVVATGGILETPAVAANADTISGSTITSANGQDLIFIDNDSTGGTLTVSSNIIDNGSATGVTKSGPGTLILNPSTGNTFTGQVTVNLGTLVLGNANALNSATPVAVVLGGQTQTFGTTSPAFFTGSGALQLSGNSFTVASLSSNALQPGTASVFNGSAASATLTVNAANNASSFAGVLSDGTGGGTLGLKKTGGLTFTLSGNNTYTGNTTVSAGTLALVGTTNNISGSKNISVASGATIDATGLTSGLGLLGTQTLAGAGSVLGSVSTSSGTIINPGDGSSIGTISVGGLTVNTGSVVNFEFGSGNDLINVTGNNGLVLNGAAGGIKLNILTSGSSIPFTTVGTYDLFQFVGNVGGAGVSALTDFNIPAGTTATFGTTTVGGNNFVTLTLGTTPVPTWNLSGGGSWNTAGNWTPAGVPNGAGAAAVLGSSITGPSSITLDGNETVGTLSFNNPNQSYTVASGTGGSLIFDNGSTSARLAGSAGTHTISAPVTLNSNLFATISAGSVTIGGVISEGSAGKSITMDGAGTLVLGVANSYTGGTNLNGGVLQINTNQSLGTGAVTFTGSGTLQAGAAGLSPTNTIAVNSGVIGSINTNGFNMTLTSAITSADATGQLVKAGTGTLTVTGAKTFSGTAVVNGGALQLGDGTTAGSVAGAINDNASLIINPGANATVSNNISGIGSMTVVGTSVVTLSGTSTFSGGMNIPANGNVVFSSAAAAGNGKIGLANGATLTLNGAASLFDEIDIPAGATVNVELSTGNNQNLGYGGAFVGSGNVIFTLLANQRPLVFGDWSGFTGNVSVAAGGQGFRTSNPNFQGGGATFDTTGTTIYGTVTGGVVALGAIVGTGDIGGNAATTANPTNYVIGGAVGAGQTDVYPGAFTNSSNLTAAAQVVLTKVGPGTLNMAGTNSFTGSVAVQNGVLTFANAAQVPTGIANITMGSATTAGTLDLTGFGTLNLTTLATVAGSVAGNNVISSSSTNTPTTINFATGTSNYGGILQDSINGGTQTLALIVNSGNLTLSGTNSYTGGTTINGGTLQLGSGGTTGSIVSTPTTTITNNGVLAFNRSDNVAFGAIISGTGGVTQAGTGITTLTNAGNNFSGTVTVSNGTLQMVPGVQLGNGAVPLVANAGTFDLNGTSTTIGSLNGAAAGVIDNVSAGGAATLTTGSLSVDATFAGTIKNTTGTIALVKNGTANLTLSGSSTYSGGTTVNSGAIFATNTTGSATGSGPVLLNGGTLGGTGFLGGTITAGSGPHTISPGANTPNAIGTLTAGGLSTNANTTLAVDLVAPGGINDLLAITGNVSLNGGNITLGSNPLAGLASLGFYKIATYSGTLSGTGMTVEATSTAPNVVYTLDTSTAGVINIHKGFLGDANDDGGVDLTDLSIVLNNFGSATTSWSLGNFDGGTNIDLTDLSEVLNNFGSSVATTAVSTGSALAATPEPASLAIVVPAAMALLRRRRLGSR